MLYSLIPPILIVLSLAGIILFLMKKAPAIAKLRNAEDHSFPQKNINGKTLLLLEKLTRRFKIFFLKLENIFTGLGETIKRKRNGQTLSQLPENNQGRTFSREKYVRPILSEKIAVPKIYSERKDLFENILIERIAANPKDVEAYERLGEYYLEIGSRDDSKECFKQVIKLDAKNENAKAKLKRLERMLG